MLNDILIRFALSRKIINKVFASSPILKRERFTEIVVDELHA
jgi:hypothetical protein